MFLSSFVLDIFGVCYYSSVRYAMSVSRFILLVKLRGIPDWRKNRDNSGTD
jgi:hypothetical protein